MSAARFKCVRSSMFLALAVVFIACPALSAESNINAFFDEFTNEWVRGNPDLATGLRYFSGPEQDALERQLTPLTRKYELDRIRLAERGLKRLKSFDRGKLSDTQRISADLMQWQLESTVRIKPHLDFYFPLEQFNGANVSLVETLTLRHPLVTPRDAENYVARLGSVDDRMREALHEAKRLAKRKRIPPRFIIEATLDSMRKFVDAPAVNNPLVTSFDQRMANIEQLDAMRREALKTEAARIVDDQVYPVWRESIAFLESLLPIATNDAGIWRFRGGDKAYADALYRFTTTRMTPDEIHETGLRLVAQIESRMDEILRSLGRMEGTVKERMDKLQADLTYPDPTSDASRAQIMRDIDVYMKDAIERSAQLFERTPVTPVIAQPFPRFREANAAANYNRAPFDGSRPAIFQMPLRPERMTKLGLRTLVYHETVPGHHFQVALEQENKALPKFRQARALGGISALSEGWALYAEEVAVESGWYEGDPEGMLGQLNAALFRARRLVVDTGLHAKRWTRQQAIDYGIPAPEVERYVVLPGQACSYMIGKLKILELREKARRELGDKFSMRGFHSAVLNAGTVPLELLEREVERYIERERS